jgi:hypothetical protein
MKFCREEEYENRKAVSVAYPAAAKIRKVAGGWMVFETIADYETWRKQK